MDATERQFVASYWWVLTLRGIAALLFGIAAVFWPSITLVTLVYLFSAFILVSGIGEVIHGITGIKHKGTWFLSLLLGVLQIGVGVYLLRHPLVSFASLILLIGFTLIVRGVIEGVSAFSDDTSASMRTLVMIGAVISVLAGIVVLFQPAAAGVAFVWILGLYALITGPLLIALSLDAKHMLNEDEPKRSNRR